MQKNCTLYVFIKNNKKNKFSTKQRLRKKIPLAESYRYSSNFTYLLESFINDWVKIVDFLITANFWPVQFFFSSDSI